MMTFLRGILRLLDAPKHESSRILAITKIRDDSCLGAGGRRRLVIYPAINSL